MHPTIIGGNGQRDDQLTVPAVDQVQDGSDGIGRLGPVAACLVQVLAILLQAAVNLAEPTGGHVGT